MRIKWNTESVKKEMEKDNYKLLSEYKNNRDKLTIKCDKGHIYEANWDNYKNKNSRCPYCSGRIITIDYIKEELLKDGTILISKEYVNAHKNLEVKCPKCNKIYTATWNNLKKGKRCPHCRHNHTIDIKYIKNFAENEGYKVLSDTYVNAYKELTFECSHGHVFNLVWCYFQSGTRCPYCKISKGEEEVSKILLKYNIENEREKTFENCTYKGKLRFDFYLPEYNICIEYDGKQHFIPQDFSGHGNSEEEFKETQIRDSIKNQYCKDNNIKLIRIPYFEFENIENILKQELNLIKTFND